MASKKNTSISSDSNLQLDKGLEDFLQEVCNLLIIYIYIFLVK